MGLGPPGAGGQSICDIGETFHKWWDERSNTFCYISILCQVLSLFRFSFFLKKNHLFVSLSPVVSQKYQRHQQQSHRLFLSCNTICSVRSITDQQLSSGGFSSEHSQNSLCETAFHRDVPEQHVLRRPVALWLRASASKASDTQTQPILRPESHRLRGFSLRVWGVIVLIVALQQQQQRWRCIWLQTWFVNKEAEWECGSSSATRLVPFSRNQTETQKP